MRCWILGGNFCGHALRIVLRLFERHTRLQPRITKVKRLARALSFTGRVQADPDIVSFFCEIVADDRQLEPWWRHSSDGVALTVKDYRFSDDVGIRSKTVPQGIRDHGSAVVNEPLSSNWTEAEVVYQHRSDGDTVHVLGLSGRRDVEIGELVPAKNIETPCTLLVGVEILK